MPAPIRVSGSSGVGSVPLTAGRWATLGGGIVHVPPTRQVAAPSDAPQASKRRRLVACFVHVPPTSRTPTPCCEPSPAPVPLVVETQVGAGSDLPPGLGSKPINGARGSSIV